MKKPLKKPTPPKPTNNQPLKIDDLLQQLYQNQPKNLKTHIETLDRDDPVISEAERVDLGSKLVNEDCHHPVEQEEEVQEIVYDQLTNDHHQAVITAGLFLAGQNGLKIYQMKRMLSEWVTNSQYLHQLMKKIHQQLLSNPTIGLLVEQLNDTYKMVSKPELKKELLKIIKLQLKSALTPSLLEVIAIIAYNNPCSKSVIYHIRQIDPTASIEKLIRLGLISRYKRSESPGKPWLYKLTNKFFDLFGIKSTKQLPKVKVNFDQDFKPTEESFDHDFFDTNRPDNFSQE